MPDRPPGPSEPFEVAMTPGSQSLGYFQEFDRQAYPSNKPFAQMPLHPTNTMVVPPAVALRRGTKEAPQAGNKHFCLVILTKEQATDIYQMRSTTYCTDPASLAVAGKSSMVAEIYGVSPKTIRDIWNRKTWTQVTRHLWTREEADDHALQQAHAKLPREEREALKDEMKKRRGRPPGSKDSRPRRRKVKESDESGTSNYVVDEVPQAPWAYAAPMRMPGSSELLARGDDDWPVDEHNEKPSSHMSGSPMEPGTEPGIFDLDAEPGMGRSAHVELYCPEPGCPDLPLYPSVCPGTFAGLASFGGQEERFEEEQRRPRVLVGPVGDMDFLEYVSQYNAYKILGQKAASKPTPSNGSGPGVNCTGPAEEEVQSTGDYYQQLLGAVSKGSEQSHETAELRLKDSSLHQSTSSVQELHWFPGGHHEVSFNFQTPVLKHQPSPQVAPMLGAKPASMMVRRNSMVKQEGGSRQHAKYVSRILESPPPEDHGAALNDWMFEPSSPTFEDMLSSGTWYSN